MIELPQNIAKDFWNRVRTLLKANKKTQIDMCNETGINLATLKGQMTRDNSPTVDEIFLIAEYLHVSIDFLITGKQKEKDQVDLDKVREALQVALDMINK